MKPTAGRLYVAAIADIEILIDAWPSPAVERFCDLAESEFSRYEQTFSRFREDSELSRLNRAGRVQPSPQLVEVIRLARAARDRPWAGLTRRSTTRSSPPGTTDRSSASAAQVALLWR